MKILMKSFSGIWGVFFALILAQLPALGQDANHTVTTVCSKCHGMDGNSTVSRYPKLAGQGREYLSSQLKAFRDHSRRDPDAHTSMWGPTQSLTDGAISDISTYFSTRKPSPGTPGNAKLAEKGKVIYERGIESKKVPACAWCHGQQAQGTPIIPRLAGQHAEYLVKQIKVFHGNYRPGLAVTMKAVVDKLSNDEAEQVAAYVQGL